MFELHTEIEIDASAERVWSIIVDFASYPQWNRFIRHISGSAKQGAALEVQIQPSGGKGMTFRPTVLVLEPSRELRWIGRLLMPGIFDGERRFVIESLPEGKVRFEHAEQFGHAP